MGFEVTIAIPVYKAVDYIENTMMSALSQVLLSVEFLILDDCGEDGSMKVIERLQKEHPRGNNIRILRNGANLGVGEARNVLLREARGKYLFFLDSDDIITKEALQTLYVEARKNDADIVYGSWEIVDMIGNGPSVKSVYPYMKFVEQDELAMYAFKNYSSFRISVCNCLMKTSSIRKAKLHFVDACFWEDMAFTYEMVTKFKKAVFIPQITYYYLCRANSISHSEKRRFLRRDDILDNLSVVNYLKDKINAQEKHTYLPYQNFNLGMNSFYIMCYVLKYRSMILPPISNSELKTFMRIPLGIFDIVSFRGRRVGNVFLWALSHLPNPLFILVVRFCGRALGVI